MSSDQEDLKKHVPSAEYFLRTGFARTATAWRACFSQSFGISKASEDSPKRPLIGSHLAACLVGILYLRDPSLTNKYLLEASSPDFPGLPKHEEFFEDHLYVRRPLSDSPRGPKRVVRDFNTIEGIFGQTSVTNRCPITRTAASEYISFGLFSSA